MKRALLALAALLVAASPLRAKDRELSWDSGTLAGKRSAAGTGHAIGFSAPQGRWYLKAVRIYGARYGGGYDPAATKFTVFLLDASGKTLASVEAPYSRFSPGRFEWVDLGFDAAVVLPRQFRVVAAFDPSRTRGIFVGYADTKRSHSGWTLPGESVRPFDPGEEWMIRVVLSHEKPKPSKPPPAPSHSARTYLADFDFLMKTIERGYPALKKKGVDPRALAKEWRPRFAACLDDKTHLENFTRLLAALGDMHTGVLDSSVDYHVPAFDGLYGAGMWIASDRGRLVLRALVPRHPLAARLHPGAELLTVEGRPAKILLEEERTKLREWYGWSSTHFLDARLSFQFFPFGKKRTLRARFLNPDGQKVDVTLPRWGPDGRGLSRAAVTLPGGLEAKGLAAATRLSARIGYVRILGEMDEATRKAFFAALDTLKGVKGLLLDCRGMGGGGDGPAWAMAGRFFEKRTPLERGVTLEPTGDWQFDGPVVMLTDEREVSSAETFTWAMAETGRVVSVGRPTGGATIIPRVYSPPSRLFRFRMGVTDRRTPIRRAQPEGVGTAPDIFVPYEPVLLAGGADPIRGIGREILGALVEGAPRDDLVSFADGILRGDAKELSRARGAIAAWKKKGAVPDLEAILQPSIEWQITLLESPKVSMPDFVEGVRQLRAWAAVAAALDKKGLAKKAEEAAQGDGKDCAAQEAWEALVRSGRARDAKARAEFCARHRGTRYAAAVAAAYR